MSAYQQRLEAWQRTRQAARERLDEIRGRGEYAKTPEGVVNSLIVKAHRPFDPVRKLKLPRKTGYMRTSAKGLASMAMLRVMVADNHSKADILDMIDWMMAKARQ